MRDLRWDTRPEAGAPNGSGTRLIGGLLVVTAFFLVTAASDLGRRRPMSADDVWAYSGSARLAAEGTLGYTLYRGVFGADAHQFFDLPGAHVAQALVIRTLGPGLGRARMVSVLSAVAVIWITGLLACRWYGLGVGLLAAALVVVWRSGLMLLDHGVPLLSTARTTRYDLMAVALMWGSVLAFDALVRRPRAPWACFAGLLAGAAALTHFYGGFVLIALLAAGWWLRVRWQLLLVVAGMAALVLLPYVGYVIVHLPDAAGQIRYLHGARGGLSDPVVLFTNLITEWRRWFTPRHEALTWSVGRWVFLVGVIPAAAWVARRAGSGGRRLPGAPGDRLLFVVLVVVGFLLALIDRTKAPIYGLPLHPGLAIAVAAAASATMTWLRGREEGKQRWASGLVGALLVLTVAEGAAVYVFDRLRRPRPTSFTALAERLAAQVPGESGAVGSERWWWGFQDRPYLAARALWLAWVIERDRGRTSPSFAGLVGERDISYVLMNDDVRGDLRIMPPDAQDAFRRFVEECTAVVGRERDATYGEVEIRQVAGGCRTGARP